MPNETALIATIAAGLVAERELAVSLARHALRHFDVPHDMEEVAARALGHRGRHG